MNAPRRISNICASIGDIDGLTFRPWTVADAPTLVSAWTDPEIARWNPVPPEPTVAVAERWITSTFTQNEASVGIDVVGVRDDAVAGEIGLQIDPAQAIGEVGFWVDEAHRGSGIGRSLLTFAEQLGAAVELTGLVALVDVDNAAALRLLTAHGWSEIPTKSARRAFAHRVAAPA